MDDDMMKLARWTLKRRDYLYGQIDKLEQKTTPGIDRAIGTMLTRIHVHDLTLQQMQSITGIDYVLADESEEVG